MKLQRVFALTKKEMKKTVREPAVLFMIFLFPIVFVFAFGASFGGVGGGQPVYQMGVVNLDQANSVNSSQILLTALSNTKILSIQIYADNQTAQNDLSQGKIQAVMIIPTTFSQSFASYQAAPNAPSKWINATISLYLDKGSVVATQAIPPIIQQVLAAFADENRQAAPSPINLQTASLIEVKQASALDFIAPGMFTFASIFLIMMVAQSFAQDRENGMMKRIRITPTTPTEFMTSQVLSYMVIALIQAILVFVMVYLMGFRPNVGILSLRVRFHTGAGVLAVQRRLRLNHSHHRKITRRSNWNLLPLRAPTTVPRHLRRRIPLLSSTSSWKIRTQLLRHGRLNLTLPKRRRYHQPRCTIGHDNIICILHSHLGHRHNPVRKILQNLNKHYSPQIETGKFPQSIMRTEK